MAEPGRLVRAYLERALPGGEAAPDEVLITQEGRMWRSPGTRALRFSASQRLAVAHVGFCWRASFPLLPHVAIEVTDEYTGGEGSLRVRLAGIPLARQRGPETTLGQALRYLAELPWVPHAMTANRELEWRQVGDRAVQVAAEVGAARAAVRMDFDAAGDIVRTSCPDRPRRAGRAWSPTPWGGEFADYALIGGMRMPTSAEVWWDLPEGRFTYWRARVTCAATA